MLMPHPTPTHRLIRLPPGRFVLSTAAEEPEVAEDWAEARRLLAEDDGDDGDA